MDADKINSELNKKFNLAGLIEKIDAGFSYIAISKGDSSKLDWLEWTQRHDKKRTESAYLMLPQFSYVFDGEVPVVVFKNSALAQSFANDEDIAEKETGVLKMKKTPDSVVFSPV